MTTNPIFNFWLMQAISVLKQYGLEEREAAVYLACLELCPAEVGPHLRLNYKNQPLGEWFRIAMKQISDPDSDQNVFFLVHDADGVWLSNYWTRPAYQWDPGDEFVFRLSK